MSQKRLDFIDNLRSVAIVLVVTMHAAVTYSNFGRWYFMEAPPTGKMTRLFFGMYQSFLQAWFMGFLFLLAGYFAPVSFDRKGAGRFIADRAVRLGVPYLIFALAIHPFVVWILLPWYRVGHTRPFFSLWLKDVSKFQFIGDSGPLWFAVALLIFSLVYAGARMIWNGPPRQPETPPTPGSAAVAGLILTIAVCTFLMRVVQPIGTAVLNMQLCFFSQYIILFIVGIRACRENWLTRIPYPFGIRWFIAAQVGGVILWLAAIIGGGALSGASMKVFDGGWHWQSAAISFWESFYCVGTCLGLTVIFRERFNSKGRAARFLSDNAFSVYVFHTPVLIWVTMLLHPLQAPPVARFVLASVLAFIVTLLASEYIFRRIPLLKRVL